MVKLIKKLFSITEILIFLTGCTFSTQPASNNNRPRIEFKECQLSAQGIPTHVPAECIDLQVYEDQPNQTGRRINLRVAKIPAVSRSPKPDPLVILAGGPGQAATETYVLLSAAFEQIHQKRDIILVDQRGAGKSSPLHCSEQTSNTTNLSNEPTDLEQAINMQFCLKHLEADPRLYTTPIAMMDLDQVRATLGYDQINLYGVSYGTRAALVYLRMYPERVRAIILDGVVPMDWLIGPDTAADAQNSLELILKRCANDPVCQNAFPNLEKKFDSLLTALEKAPVEVEFPDPLTGQNIIVKLTRSKAADAIRLLSYTEETASIIPLLIHDAQTSGNYQRLAAQYRMVTQDLNNSISDGMYLSVICSEDTPFFPTQIAPNNDTYIADMTPRLQQMCKSWVRAELPAGYHDPVHSNVPVLMLSGEADPITPPSNAEHAAQTLPNSRQLVAAGQGHNVIYRGCIPKIAASFIEKGDIKDLDTDCLNDLKPLPFFTGLTGPTP
jgi:pimeloyl-ACP methyl ester carboxylesterase